MKSLVQNQAIKSIFVAFSMMLTFALNGIAQEATTPSPNPTPTPAPTPAVVMGKVSGKIIDKANGEALIGVVVKAKDYPKAASTDIEGRFTLKLPVGVYDITLTYISYKTELIQAVEVKAGEVTELDLTMEENIMQTEEVVVVAKRQQESSNFVLVERKNSAQVSDGVSSETIKKTPDRSTADVLKRVTGASIQDGKFAIIRGMNDRYNAGYLNGAPLPSTESDRKAFAFDIIPANLIDNLQIIKTGSPDLTGDFAGGIIQINTKSIPSSFTQNLSVGTQYNSITTFKTFERMGAKSGDNFGINSSERDIPAVGDLLVVTKKTKPASLVAPSKLFDDDYAIQSATALPNLRLSYSLGAPIKLNDKGMELGVLFALNYANSRVFKEATVFKNSYQDNTFLSELHDKNYNLNVTSGGLLNFSFKVNPKHIISWRNTLNRNSDFTTILREGSMDLPSNNYSKSYANLQNFNSLYCTQLAGEHKIKAFKINWILNRANISRVLPDYRLTTYLVDKTDPSNAVTSLYTPNFFSQGTGRFWSNLNEVVNSANLDVLVPLNFFGDKIKLEGKIGGFAQKRNRVFTARNFVYQGNVPGDATNPNENLSSNNIGKDSLLINEKTSKILDNYDAVSSLYAGYIMADLRIMKKLRFSGGVRLENFKQTLTNAETEKFIDDNGNPSKIYDKAAVLSFLPSVNAVYSLTEKINIRASAYKTVNRPEFREVAEFSFFNFAINSTFIGNKNLKQANITNYDLRFEMFPSANELLSFGLFYKKISNPIEFSKDVTTSERQFNFANEGSAFVKGIEIEVRKSFLENFTGFGNISFIASELSFNPGSNSTPGRSLQGQSPYIINIGLQYENFENGWFASIMGNRNGERIAFVGAPGREEFGGDIYEAPRTVVDFQVGKEIGKLNLKLTVGDVFHQDLLYYINLNSDKSYNEGVDNKLFLNTNGFTTSIAASYSF